MKRSLLPVLTLAFAAIAFIGCDSAIAPAVDTAGLNTSRSAATSGGLSAVTVSGPLAVIDGEYAVLYQGNPWYIKGLANPDFTEGSNLTVAGVVAPILDRDNEGNSLFYGYYLQVF
jgi:hypothetical protein